jgi:hypothetical protein
MVRLIRLFLQSICFLLQKKKLLAIHDTRIILDSLSIAHGEVRDVEISVYSIMRNESFFLQAFLDHYRSMGVQQFLILDDRSTDGSFEFLKSQNDCVVLSSTFRFGNFVYLKKDNRNRKTIRAGTLLKSAIPQKYLRGKYSIYADADEFLVLPPGLADLRELIKRLKKNNIECVAASQVELYPKNLSELTKKVNPQTLDDILALSPFFDSGPIVRLVEGAQPKKCGPSTSERLFRQYGVREGHPMVKWLPNSILRRLGYSAASSSVFKTPIIKHSERVHMVGSHMASVPPDSTILLALLHFKFSCEFRNRIERALQWRSHSGKGAKYRNFHLLYKRMARRNGTFFGPSTTKYTGPKTLEESSLMKFKYPSSDR